MPQVGGVIYIHASFPSFVFQVRRGKNIGVCPSVDNCRLFIGGIPKTVVKEQIMIEMQKNTEGVKDVIVYPSANDKTKNRGKLGVNKW